MLILLEIRTPLNGIHGMANFLIDTNLTAEQMDQVNVIRASTEGLRDLINDILDLSKVEAGMITLNYDWLYIRAVVEEVNDLTSSMAIDKNIELNYIVEDDVPIVAKGDKFRIRQVLLNVIGNAIKFTQVGEVLLWCKVAPHGATTDSIMIQFDITDSGRGFTEREAEKLFKRFSQIDASSTRQHGGTGLGLVISMQLVELHGGIMTAKSVPGKGSTFTFSIRLKLPSDTDRPPATGRAVEGSGSSVFRGASSKTADSSTMSSLEPLPVILDTDLIESPVPEGGQSTTAVPSPGSSIASLPSTQASGRSNRSSASSQQSAIGTDIRLSTGIEVQMSTSNLVGERDISVIGTERSDDSLLPQPGSDMILIVCPLTGTRVATEKHLRTILPRDLPAAITSVDSITDDSSLSSDNGPASFTHIVLVLPALEQIMASLDKILSMRFVVPPAIIVVTDAAQKKDIIEHGTAKKMSQHFRAGRIRFTFRPIKPSKLSIIFDPSSLRESSMDHNKTNAQQVAATQKQLFADMSSKLGNRGVRVLLVEDNKINQIVCASPSNALLFTYNLQVMLKLLKRVSVDVETVFDGVQCTDKVFSKPVGYYSIILVSFATSGYCYIAYALQCDLHMPNKDGYQTCKDVRTWERENKHAHLPIIALSANVLGDVWAKCVEAGFNSYLTKPVEFRELSDVMTAALDTSKEASPLEFMKHR